MEGGKHKNRNCLNTGHRQKCPKNFPSYDALLNAPPPLSPPPPPFGGHDQVFSSAFPTLDSSLSTPLFLFHHFSPWRSPHRREIQDLQNCRKGASKLKWEPGIYFSLKYFCEGSFPLSLTRESKILIARSLGRSPSVNTGHIDGKALVVDFQQNWQAKCILVQG